MAELNLEGHVLYALRNAQVKKWPFPHFFVENVFPADFYRILLAGVAARTDYIEGEKHYNGRKFGQTDHFSSLDFMKSKEFLREVCKIFADSMKQRFSDANFTVYSDLRFIRDGQGYFIGPHTDATWKIVSLLFYLPTDTQHAEHGTSIYLPKDRTFTCFGGPHHDFAHFDRIATAPYLPNSCFGFFKTCNSFHGVEPINVPIRRDVLLYNIYEGRAQLPSHSPSPEQQP